MTETQNAKCSAGKMTLDEAIEHLNETLANKKDWACESCKNEHIQLRKWLAELKSLEGKYNGQVEKYNALADRYNRQGQALKLELEENRALTVENEQLKKNEREFQCAKTESKGFYVFNPNAGKPCKVHANLDEAKTEAARLAKEKPGAILEVLEIVSRCTFKGLEWE